MQFNSYIFILAFLPLFLIVYYLVNRVNKNYSRVVIILGGMVFYLYAGLSSFFVLTASCIVNISIYKTLDAFNRGRKALLIVGIVVNIIPLFVFQYTNLAITTINDLFNAQYTILNLVLPLGISFFTFQQIMYIVGVYKNEIVYLGIIDYLSYVFYFPKLVMGPITEPNDLLKQFNDDNRKVINTDNIASGIKLFCYGFFKKMILADTFANGVSWGFDNINSATSGDFILVMLFYTFEIYFDFSGYSDMAVGISKMINIDLPINFDSPYKALSIRDFWKRWHISLTKFLTKYIYFPLGGSRKGTLRTYVNIMIVFLISGLWHGANWTFILWGCLYGVLQILERIFDKYYNKLFVVVRWIYTFGVVNVLWLLFRADSIAQWHRIIYRIVSLKDLNISQGMIKAVDMSEITHLLNAIGLGSITTSIRGFIPIILLAFAFIICLIPNNNYKTQNKTNAFNVVVAAIVFIWGVLSLGNESVFVYFNF